MNFLIFVAFLATTQVVLVHNCVEAAYESYGSYGPGSMMPGMPGMPGMPNPMQGGHGGGYQNPYMANPNMHNGPIQFMYDNQPYQFPYNKVYRRYTKPYWDQFAQYGEYFTRALPPMLQYLKEAPQHMYNSNKRSTELGLPIINENLQYLGDLRTKEYFKELIDNDAYRYPLMDMMGFNCQVPFSSITTSSSTTTTTMSASPYGSVSQTQTHQTQQTQQLPPQHYGGGHGEGYCTTNMFMDFYGQMLNRGYKYMRTFFKITKRMPEIMIQYKTKQTSYMNGVIEFKKSARINYLRTYVGEYMNNYRLQKNHSPIHAGAGFSIGGPGGGISGGINLSIPRPTDMLHGLQRGLSSTLSTMGSHISTIGSRISTIGSHIQPVPGMHTPYGMHSPPLNMNSPYGMNHFPGSLAPPGMNAFGNSSHSRHGMHT